MTPEEIGNTLRERYQEAAALLKEREIAFNAAPDDFALELSFNSFQRHVNDLKNQLDAFEALDHGVLCTNPRKVS